MPDVEVTFERENQHGIVAVGSYLIDAAKRFGIKFKADCIQAEGIHHCAVIVTSGSAILAPLTKTESEHFKVNRRSSNERLACQARIESPAEVVVMTKETKENAQEDAKAGDKSEQYKKEFAELPLEKKIANLVQLEAIALGETFSFIINSPFKVFDKVMDVMAEFGLRKEEDAKNATRPEEHKAETQPKPSAKRAPRHKGARPKAGN